MIGFLHVGSFALYGFAGALLGISLVREARRLTALASVILAAGLVVHAVALADYVSRWDQLPFAWLGPSLSTLAFLTGLGCLLAATLGHANTVGIVLVPLVTLLTGVAAFVGVAPAGEPLDWFIIHVVFAFVGLAGLTVSFAAGLMYLLQYKQLKGKHFGTIFRFFPPLETLDNLGKIGLLVGFPFLTLSLVLGWARAFEVGAGGSPASGKLAWVVLSWLVLLIALLARYGKGERGERGALVSVIGFIVVVVVYVIVRAQTAHNGTFL